ncbi:MAG: L-threonylcarbamoyladenylate synthase [Bacillota bacterium]|nr:L-threonylcarbamoyladenylate synthase [Bacillota bacterium]
METRRLSGRREEEIRLAAAILRDGGLVAFPTETVYGLGADATNPQAVRGIFAAKGRPADNPLIVHVTGAEALDQAAEPTTLALELARRFWPGPLTLVLPKRPGVADEVTAGLKTVGVRVPDHPVALALLRATGRPVAAPSANRSGRPSPTTAEDVLADLDGRIDAVLDGGPCRVGVESTVVDLTVRPAVVLRVGGLPLEELRPWLPGLEIDPAILGQLAPRPEGAGRATGGAGAGEATPAGAAAGAGEGSFRPRAPGMKYRHYAPRVPLFLVRGEAGRVRERAAEIVRELRAGGRRVAVIAPRESLGYYDADFRLDLGPRAEPAAWAARLFRALREAERSGASAIVAEAPPAEGLGLAVAERLSRAASRIVDC